MAIVGILTYGALTDPGRNEPAQQFIRQQDPDLYREVEYTKDYHACIENIMFNEDFRSEVYLCAAGHRTIGFGHKIKPMESFEKLTWGEAYRILKDDFHLSIVIAKLYGFERNDGQQLAVAHAVYCLGRGTTLDIVQKGFPRVIMRYCYYRGKNGMVFNQRIKESRQFELSLWSKKY